MSEQDKIAFEKWWEDFKSEHEEWKYADTLALIKAGYEAATLESAERIAALEGEVAELKAQKVRHDQLVDYLKCGIAEELEQRILELQASNNDLREALEHADEFIRNGIEFGYVRMPDESLKGIDSAHDTPEIIRKALSATPAESLQAHDDFIIEQCAIVSDGFGIISNDVYIPDSKHISKAIRALKQEVK